MRRYRHARRRRGASVVEFAIIAPVVFLLFFGTIIGGVAVFRYQQIACLAREGARWASVHGTQYATTTGNTAATATDVYNNAIAGRMAGLLPANMTYAVNWSTNNSPFHTVVSGGNLTKVDNLVTVTVNYRWTPEWFFVPLNLSSTSVMPMSF